MEILINGKNTDIKLDTEKTLGDVLAGMELWISPSGNRIHGITIDGKSIDNDIAAVSGKDIREIKKIEISIIPWRELAAEALYCLLETCVEYRKTAFDDRKRTIQNWNDSAAARFLKSDIKDISLIADQTFSGSFFSPEELSLLLEERLMEINNPGHEIAASEALVHAISKRMEELPLDMQTGKDGRAAETIQLFSGVGQKLFRIFSMLKSEGLSMDTFTVDGQPARTFMEEFNAALSELSAAYENRDTVLVGDLSEYELAPRLLKFFSALKNLSEMPLASVDEGEPRPAGSAL